MSNKKTSLEAMLRPLAAKSRESALVGLYKVRNSVKPPQYARLIQAFKRAAPRHASSVPVRARAFKDLYWLPAPTALSLRDELEWAVPWLSSAISRLNLHSARVKDADELFNRGQLGQLALLARESIVETGWSFWAASLLIASEAALSKGKESATLLEGEGSGRISGLLARMMRDRNDQTISFPTFEARCKHFLEKLTLDNEPAIYRFRALAEFEDDKDVAAVLSADAVSSFVDYYETLVSAATHALVDVENDDDVALIVAALSKLESQGLSDLRIERIRSRIERATIFVYTERTRSDIGRLADRCSQFGTTTPAAGNPWLCHIHDSITNVDTYGIRASDDADELLRSAANFQSLPTGRALWSKGIQTYVSAGAPLIISGFEAAVEESPYALLTQNDSRIEAAIRESSNPRALELRDGLDGALTVGDREPDAYDLWLTRVLIERGRFDDARRMVESLAAGSGVWERYSKRFRVQLDIESGNLAAAITQAATLLATDRMWAYELVLPRMFENVPTKRMLSTPSWAVAFVAHHATQMRPISKLRVACRMACRRVYQDMRASGVESYLNGLSVEDRSVVCVFLSEAWTDENLSMVEDMSTSQEVRRERIAVFQALISVDTGQADKYRGMIQDLTFDETLWSGLRLIDSNRVFVNEAGITRWADKELAPEYDRWRAVRASSAEKDLRADQMLRSYLLDKDLEALMQASPLEEQTESGILLFGVISKLFNRFLLDPAHGLNSYLSLRVRHGTLRGTLLGPLEEEQLLLCGEFSEAEFEKRWGASLSLSTVQKESLKSKLRGFGERLDRHATWLIGEKVQISSASKPHGLFPARLDAKLGTGLLGLTDPSISFSFFVNQCYLVFWSILAPFREDLSRFFREDVNDYMQSEFTGLISDIETEFGELPVRSVATALRALATRTTESCRIIANWFVPENPEGVEAYDVNVAVAIARKATSNIYRGFQADLQTECDEDAQINLSTSGLGILYDALYVILANAWVHSELGENLNSVALKIRFDGARQLLIVRAENDLSNLRRLELETGELAALRLKYLKEVPMELVPVEGGSGFAKLARIASAVDREKIPSPLDFGITSEGKFFVSLSVQLYAREGVFDAYL